MRYFPLASLQRTAVSQPEALAVQGVDEEWTYKELADQALILSISLAAMGVGSGDRVCVLASKAPATVATFYAIWRIGAVVVPLDPYTPRDRLQQSLADCTPSIVLFCGDRSPEQLLNGPMGVRFLSIDSLLQVNPDAPASFPESLWEEDDVALILYTSGSTGRPKGVAITAGNLSHFVGWSVLYFDLKTSDRVGSVAPFHFDLSLFDLYTTCAVGASLHLPELTRTPLPSSLATWIERRQITAIYTVPTALRLLVAHGNLSYGRLRSLRLIMSAGEVLTHQVCRDMNEFAPDAQIYNLYGPTETNVCIVHKVSLPAEAPVPIGGPVGGAVVELGKLGATVGTRYGQIFVTSSSVAAGYWGTTSIREDAQRTRAVAADPSPRSHATGDFAEREPSGQYIFRGRKDRRVKIRGHRVELDEVEMAVANFSRDLDCAVVTLQLEGQVNEIVCFIQAPVADVLLRDLMAHCRARLPRVAVPRMVLLDALPRTSTGKIDRALLQAEVSVIR